MIIYKVCAQLDGCGACLWWEASKKDGNARRRKILEDQGDALKHPEVTVRKVNIPTDKAGLIGWLNSNVKNDNQ